MLVTLPVSPLISIRTYARESVACGGPRQSALGTSTKARNDARVIAPQGPSGADDGRWAEGSHFGSAEHERIRNLGRGGDPDALLL